MYVSRFINIYMYVGNTTKSYIVKQRKYLFRVVIDNWTVY